MRKIISICLLVFVFFGVIYADGDNPSLWAKEDVEFGISHNLIHKDLRKSYREKISRQDFCKLAVHNYLREKNYNNLDEFIAAEIPIEFKSYRYRFEDLNYNSKDSKYVIVANILGFVKGTSETTFSPKHNLTREQAATILISIYEKIIAKEIDFTKESYQKYFDNDKISSWAKDSVYMARKIELMRGIGNNMFNPSADYSTEQAIVSLMGIVEVYEKEEKKELTRYKNEVIRLCNLERQKRGISLLKESKKLNSYADLRAQEIVETFDHKRPNGEPFYSGISDYRMLGENIAAGQRTPKQVVDAWMNSDHHKENILNPDFEEISIGLKKMNNLDSYSYYWVQEFYTPLK